MPAPIVLKPLSGSRIVKDGDDVVLFGQPPEVLKGLLLNGITDFSTLVLTDIKERDGSLMNNLEFPLYFFLFVAKGLEQGRRLRLVGSEADISQALRLLRLTLMGPTAEELKTWGTEQALAEEWLSVSEALALKNAAGKVIPIEDFFDICPFNNGTATAGKLKITHLNLDRYEVTGHDGSVIVDLHGDNIIEPPYKLQTDYVPGGLVKMGLEILGGASGFTPNEPCTGLALCYNGDYILIDAPPFLDHHLFARGISKNQVSAIFLTHLHDDHCALFPLMMMPHKVDVITTQEIFNMAMDKLSCNLGWEIDVIKEHFNLIEVRPGKSVNYFGLTVKPHVTVHSIPTVGATFSTTHKGVERQLCVIGDNHSMGAVREMHKSGIVPDNTMQNLERIYTDPFSLLVADGGAGAIHGDPSDALTSDADRVLFVHVEQLPHEFDTTFSLANSGKRYTIIEGDPDIYASQVNHYLSEWLGQSFPNRWMRSLLAEEEIYRYNTDDVVIVQDAKTRGAVYLILTGYCEVIHHDGKHLHTVAKLQAGDILGEMAVITGKGTRNASVVAKTPVTVCIFSEDTFGAFIKAEEFAPLLLKRWALRPVIKDLPQFNYLNSNVRETLGRVTTMVSLEPGEPLTIDDTAWLVLADGEATFDNEKVTTGAEFGAKPYSSAATGVLKAKSDCILIKIEKNDLDTLCLSVPRLNYSMRKHRIEERDSAVDWLIGNVST